LVLAALVEIILVVPMVATLCFRLLHLLVAVVVVRVERQETPKLV
jgi:hypothetical protein